MGPGRGKGGRTSDGMGIGGTYVVGEEHHQAVDTHTPATSYR